MDPCFYDGARGARARARASGTRGTSCRARGASCRARGRSHRPQAGGRSEDYLEYERQMEARYSDDEIQVVEHKHEQYIRNIILNQGNEYNKLIDMGFFSGSHETIQIIELKDCVDYLTHGLSIQFIEDKCTENPVLRKLRESLSLSIFAVTSPERNYLYGPTIRALMKILDFYDILIRSIREIPEYYHKYRYERYVEYCISSGGLFMIPTFASIGATDFLKLRAFPLFPVGLNIKLEFVDEFYQSPIEFFIHDINHSRRMYESNIRDMETKNVDTTDQENVTEYYKQSNDCVKKLMRIINNKINSKGMKAHSKVMKELLHYHGGERAAASLAGGSNPPILIRADQALARPAERAHQVSQIDIPTIVPDGTIVTKPVYHLEMDDYSTIDKSTPIDLGYSQLIKIIVFEITHEDALPMSVDVICSTILRNSGIETDFSRVSPIGKIETSIELGGSILGFVKYKLRNGFFDSVENPLDFVVRHFYRTDKQIAIATQILLAKMCDNVVSNNSPNYERIMINITDKEGLNTPLTEDLLASFMPEILNNEKYGDLTEEDVNKLRLKIGRLAPNEYTGDRPKPVTEQGNLLEKLGTSTRRKRNKTKKKSKRFR